MNQILRGFDTRSRTASHIEILHLASIYHLKMPCVKKNVLVIIVACAHRGGGIYSGVPWTGGADHHPNSPTPPNIPLNSHDDLEHIPGETM